jgi:hypothetical protein
MRLNSVDNPPESGARQRAQNGADGACALAVFWQINRDQRLRLWWNWQTRYFEVVVAQAVQVQVLLSAPISPSQNGNLGAGNTENARIWQRKHALPKRIRHRGRRSDGGVCQSHETTRKKGFCRIRRRSGCFFRLTLCRTFAESGRSFNTFHPLNRWSESLLSPDLISARKILETPRNSPLPKTRKWKLFRIGWSFALPPMEIWGGNHGNPCSNRGQRI